jgi:hypothetical protein
MGWWSSALTNGVEIAGFGRSTYVLISVYTKGWCMLDSKGKKKREKSDKEKLATSGLDQLEHPT